MEEHVFNSKNAALFADLAFIVAALACTVHMIGDMADSLSFGGFFILFLIVVLGVYFLGLIGALFLLPLSVRTGKARFAAIAAILQVLSPLPWLRIYLAYNYDVFSWYEIIMLVGVAAGIALLLFLPFWRRPGGGT